MVHTVSREGRHGLIVVHSRPAPCQGCDSIVVVLWRLPPLAATSPLDVRAVNRTNSAMAVDWLCYPWDDMGYRRPRLRPTRHPTPASTALVSARHAAGLLLKHVGQALGVHPRTVTRWEVGETKPTAAEWSSLVALIATRAPRAAHDLSVAAGVPSPIPQRPPVDRAAIELAIARAADMLDVPPRRVRAALRSMAHALAQAHGTLDDLLRAAEEPPEAPG